LIFGGFLSRASWIFDLVAIAMVVFLPLMVFGISLAEKKKNFAAHRKMQIFLASLLGVVLLVFEIQIRMYGWRHLLSEQSPYFKYVDDALRVHLFFAVMAAIFWLVTVVHAIYFFRDDLRPKVGSHIHRILGKASAVTMVLTAVTGWIFYGLAFVF